MILELTEQQRAMVKGQGGRPVEIVDPDTQRTYMLVALEEFERVRPLLSEPAPGVASGSQLSFEIPPGIRRSQEAFWRELPGLLKERKLRGQLACYHGDERIGIARDDVELYGRCRDRGLKQNEFYIGYIEDRALPPWESEVLEESLFEAVDS